MIARRRGVAGVLLGGLFGGAVLAVVYVAGLRAQLRARRRWEMGLSDVVFVRASGWPNPKERDRWSRRFSKEG